MLWKLSHQWRVLECFRSRSRRLAGASVESGILLPLLNFVNTGGCDEFAESSDSIVADGSDASSCEAKVKFGSENSVAIFVSTRRKGLILSSSLLGVNPHDVPYATHAARFVDCGRN